ncbi:MAG: hypothetical protein P8H03_05530 [Emcibacteraceae bacterium]|nr:hypothetical protein [Emcibacteraceae bacterium]
MDTYAQANDTISRSIPESVRPMAPSRLRVPNQFFRHDQARDAVRSGNILSLSVIRKTVQSKYPGKIVDVRLLVPKREGINYLYDVRVLTNGGKLLSVKVDAKNANIIDVKG